MARPSRHYPTTADRYEAYQTDSFVVAAGVHRVSFIGMASGEDRTTFIDQVSITRNNADVLQVNLSTDNGTLTLARPTDSCSSAATASPTPR